ncbi:MAG: succinate--CoA ligase subunit alpha [Deltaproteobacteria bacterium]|nr:succinate--CoA ligase subunit alpha [Deltaproteobacteria bacterium]MBW1935428.1 succinate--CoA ligase subunit alpha [Deltaproteobacteria bacterium]MBW1978334.1 succinate--CoA ligase subunit alpha [Deltaproteobacteria bacterium]MBW2045820.1 succinate--CoA ligase subunit alpha [Deltaproteobacteria bacterium]MBW2299564.1 succinate--CoA ligase subunit alpha [Deltaproteobacteria bacterium]
MSILLDENTKVIVQGMTGREGSLRTAFMKGYGTKVVAGVTPGRGGEEVQGIPVFDTVQEAIKHKGEVDATVTFIPGPALKNAVYEAIDSGIKFIVSPVERIPVHDVIAMVQYALKNGAKLLGPGSLGIISPGKAAMGWLGGNTEWARTLFQPGPVGVISRSGGQSGTVPWALREAGLGISTALHIGTEPVLGLSMAEVLELFEKDEQTKAVAVFGEIGGTLEEEAAEAVAQGKYTKPLVVFIAGAWAPEGMRFSHASSIVERGKGTAQGKIEALTKAGAHVVDSPEEIAPLIKKLINQ